MEARVNLYQAKSRNRRDSVLLFLGMGILFGLAGALIGGGLGMPPLGGVAIGLAVAGIQGAVGWFAGDEIVLSMSGAREVGYAEFPQLFNVVEEMSIAAGIPAPRIFVIEDSAPNAFATGKKPGKAYVAVTTGLLDKLNREELQGVIGHEIAHIRNGDVRFGILMAVLVGAIVLLCDMFWRSLRFGGARRSRSSKGGSATAILFVLAVLFAILAPILAKIIQMAWSRQREYLADASSAELTRNPLGLASALRKIAHDPEPLEAANRAMQHLYIVNPVKPFEERAKLIFATHPPVEERVRRLESIAGFQRISEAEKLDSQSFTPSQGQ